MISFEDIEQAQADWGAAVVAVGRLRDDRIACETAAAEAVDRLYAFDESAVLFKPTRAVQAPFRCSRRSAISYFIGGDGKYPEDTGFALQPWTAVRFENALHSIHDRQAFVLGNYFFTDVDGGDLKVEYSFGYLADPTGESLKIFLHHSSLPYTPPT